MKNRRLLFSQARAVMLCGLTASCVVHAADIPWTGVAANGLFTDPANWTGNVFPTAADTAVLGSGNATFNTGATVAIGNLSATSGSLTIGSGSLALNSTGQIVNFGDQGGALTMTGGSLAINNAFVYRIGASGTTSTAFNLSGASSLTASASFFVIGNGLLTGGLADTAQITSSAGNFFLGDSAGTVAFSLAGASNITSTAGNFNIGNGASTTVTMSGSSSINVSGGSLRLGNGTNASGNLIMTGTSKVIDTSGSQSVWAAGNNATANVTLSDTSSYFATKVKIGDSGSNVNPANGNITLNGSSTFTVQELTLGHFAGGGTAQVNVNTGSTLTASTYITLGRDDGAGGTNIAGVVNINGGTVAAGAIRKGGGTGAHSVNVNGGTIRALSTTADFFPSAFVGSTSTMAVTIASGGMTFDTNSFDVGLGTEISGAGGLIKIGGGNLSVTSDMSYTGATIIQAGSFDITSTGSIASTLVGLASGTTLTLENANALTSLTSIELAPSAAMQMFYNGDQTVASVLIDGVAVAPGTYTSAQLSGLGAAANVTFTSNAFTGTLTVIPEPGSLALSAVAGMLLMRRSRRA